MRDFLKDWQKWTMMERVSALLIASFFALVIPATVAVNLHHGGVTHSEIAR